MSEFLVPDEQFILERPRIHALLEKTVENSVVFITAGGGYGKTYAVYSFLRQKNKTAAWLPLTELDNTPLRFWESLIKAVTPHEPRTAKDLEELGFPETPNQIARLLSVLAGKLSHRKQFAVVVDNFHLITEKSILDLFSAFLASPYPKETIIVISLREPELNTMSLLSKGLLSRITVDDLRFNEEEIADYFRLRNIGISAEEAKEIFADTEGWVQAISLIAEEMKNGNKKYNRSLLLGESIRSMIEELFASVPVSYQRFLVTISFFDQWPLEVLSKIISSLKETLPSMEEQSVYLNRLSALYCYDVYLHGFRIHPLFLDYLREKHGAISRQEVKAACSINAQWCMENRLFIDAAINYGMAGDYEGFIKAIYSSPRVMSRSVAAAFLEILDRVLNDERRDETNKNYLYLRHITRAGLLLNLGRYDESRDGLEKSIREFESLPPSLLSSEILSACYNTLGILSLFVYRITRDISRTHEYFLRGNYHYLRSPYITPGAISKTSTGPYAILIGHPAREGEFEEFINAITLFMPYASNSLGGYLGGADSLCRAEFAFFRGELNAAEQHAREAVFKAREKRQYEIENKSLFYLLRIYLCTGNISASRETWVQMEGMLEIPDYLNRYVMYDIMTGWMYAHTGASDRIAPWLRSEFEESDLNLHYQKFETMVKAKSLFAEKRYEDTLQFLERKEVRDGVGSFLFGILEITVLKMAALSRMGDEAGALKTLETAYGMALLNPATLDMPFIELGEDMRDLTVRILTGAAFDATPTAGQKNGIKRSWLEMIRNKASGYVKKLSTASEQYRGSQGEVGKIPFLTSQELSILTGISKGLNREEIAAEASLSLSTVKNIIKTIYGKLCAINRADAIRIATGMGLLK